MNKLYLLEDSSKTAVPETFNILIQNVLQERIAIIKTDRTVLEVFSLDGDYIVCVFSTVALECGFRINDSSSPSFDVRVMRDFTNLMKWRNFSKRAYQIELFLPQLQDYRFILLVVPVFGNSVIINILTLKNEGVVRSCADCMMPSQWLSLLQPSVAERFNNLPVLARCFKKLIQREKDIALNDENKPNPSLLGIPEELKLQIFRHLAPKDFLHLTGCCKALGPYAKHPFYWKYRLKKDYNTESENPMDFYISKFCTNKCVPPVENIPEIQEYFSQ